MLPTIKRILYASDLGQHSRPAFRHTVNEALVHGAHIIFVHAIEPLHDLTDDYIKDYVPTQPGVKHSEQLLDTQKLRIQHRIESFLQQELSNTGALQQPIEIKIAIGRPYKAIVATAEREQVDLIVMGDRESNSLSRLFLGSTAQKVIHQSTVPVTIIPLAKGS
ncbi:MAG: universal stress protein [Pseudomonadales bacterium]